MYDYIIVGAGTAGCALAARLTEEPQVSVLLMEAGPPDQARAIRTPGAFPSLFRTALDWSFWTDPQERLDNRRLFWPRGKVLGGSGSINAMLHMEPCHADLIAWDDATRNGTRGSGWGPTGLREIFDAFSFDPVRASHDPAACTDPRTRAFLDAAENTGLPLTQFFNDAQSPACGPFRRNLRGGVRWSAADAYLRPALRRGNLTVWTGIHATRILLRDSRAAAVEFLRNGELHQAAVAREIVLCAGAIGSAELLLRSGVGPPEHLSQLGIPIAVPLPGVGRNLQDHLAAPVSHFATAAGEDPVSFKNRWKHRLLRSGPLASNGAEAGMVFHSQPAPGACDLAIVCVPRHFLDHGFAKPGGPGITLIPVLLAPSSRGSVRLASADPLDPPLIDPAYLSDPADLAALAQGVLKARELLKSKPLAPLIGEPVQGDPLEPAQHIRAWGQTLYNPAGSCRMGTGPDSVVDDQLRVRGLAGLRVADASVMAVIPRAPLNAATMAIAEKAARLILGPLE